MIPCYILAEHNFLKYVSLSLLSIKSQIVRFSIFYVERLKGELTSNVVPYRNGHVVGCSFQLMLGSDR